jgi:molecular chaperone GrpE
MARSDTGEQGEPVTPHEKLNPAKPAGPAEPVEAAEPAEPVEREVKPVSGDDHVDWQDKALRMQADMENFRRRQLRRADEAIAAEQKRLLLLLLPTIDNLERALNHQSDSDETLRTGVELIYRDLVRKLAQEGVTRIETKGQPFDPEWHEAAAAVPSPEPSDTVIEEVQAGYRLGDKLLRPAQVVVAA